MKLITRDTDYALRALTYIAGRKKRIITADDLVRKFRIPRPFLRKILQILNKKSVLKSFRGKRGGFILAKPPESIFVVDIMRIFQGPVKLNEHIFKNKVCPRIKTCVLKKKLDAIEGYVIRELKAISIKSLARDAR